MVDNIRKIIFKLSTLFVVLIISSGVSVAQVGQETPQALANTMVSSINAKNVAGVQALLHPQVVSYLRVTDPAMLNNITASLMSLQIPEGFKVGVISLDDLEKSGSQMAKYDKATQTLTMMGAPAYYKIPPSQLMMLAVDKEKTVEVDGKEETKVIKVPLTPTPLPIGQYQGNWYIVMAAGKK